LRSEIMLEMRDSSHNSHWQIKQKKLDGFVHLNPTSEAQK
jgi:hypothetical protein